VTLKDFRKTDYPGTEMAMAYESDVTITRQSGEEAAHRIYMNNPYAQRPWKVYQSGFVGDHVSVFSVMKDPGIPLTYAGSIVLCVGLVLTFYARSLSWGHPGIPIGIMKKEPAHEAAADSAGGPAVRPVAPAEFEGAGVA
jgi:cytochrome c biogenesis protein ResB